MCVFSHSEPQLSGPIKGIELDVESRRPLEVPGPLGSFGGSDVQPALLEERGGPQVIARARVHFPRFEKLVGLLVQAGGLGWLILVLPYPTRVHECPTPLIGVGGRIPIRHVLVEASGLNVRPLPDESPRLGKTRSRRGDRAASSEHSRNQPEQPEKQESHGNGGSDGTSGQVTDPALAVGELVLDAITDRAGLVLGLSFGQGEMRNQAVDRERQDTQENQREGGKENDGTSRGHARFLGLRRQSTHSHNQSARGRRRAAGATRRATRSRRDSITFPPWPAPLLPGTQCKAERTVALRVAVR